MTNISLSLLENYPMIGLFSSAILLFGFYELGSIIFRINFIDKIFDNLCDKKYLKIFISSNFFIIINYPLLLIFKLKIIFIISSLLIFLLGLKKIFNNISKIKVKNFSKFKKNKTEISLKNYDKYLFFFLIALYFLLSLSPITHSDALGYHLYTALSILKDGIYPISLFHFHSFLAGAGEIFIALGLLFGSDQFANIIQFISLIPVIGIIRQISNKKYFYLLLAILSPTLIFLVSASKPQLYFACSNFVIFSLFVLKFNSLNSNNNYLLFSKYFITALILIISVHGKFSFILSSGIIGIIMLLNSIYNKKIFIFIVSILSASIILYFPIIFWKTANFGGNIFDYMFTPIPTSILGSELMNPYIVNYKRHETFLYLIFPKNIGQISYSIGFACLYLLFIFLVKKKNKIFYLITGSIFIYIVVVILKGPVVARFFIEPYFWLILLLCNFNFYRKIKLLDLISRAQGLILIPILLYGIFALSPASLSKKMREKVLENNANGYLMFKWANSKLKPDDVVIVAHRSMGFANFNVIPDEFVNWAIFNNENTIKIYKDLLMEKNPRYILGEEKYLNMRYTKCLGNIFAEGIKVNIHAARNPFNKSKNKTNAHIYEIDLNKFPECVDQ